MTDKETVELVARIQNWLCTPQSHLNENSRKKILEKIVQDHIDRQKRKELKKTQAKDFLLYTSVIGVIFSALPHILKFMGISW